MGLERKFVIDTRCLCPCLSLLPGHPEVSGFAPPYASATMFFLTSGLRSSRVEQAGTEPSETMNQHKSLLL
jgi:hypothetical protein